VKTLYLIAFLVLGFYCVDYRAWKASLRRLVVLGLPLWLVAMGLRGCTLGGERSRRCLRARSLATQALESRGRYQSWLAGGSQAGTRGSSQRFLLERRFLRQLTAEGYLNGNPVCPEQGPLTQRDSSHYEAYLVEGQGVTLRCKVHGR